MASEWHVCQAQLKIPYFFQSNSLLQKALTAGDSNSHDREGHRGLAQVGDALMTFVILNEGLERGFSRKEQAENTSKLTSKEFCSTLARGQRFDQLVKISERQVHDGPQPTTLKNTLSAIIAAVWQDSHDYAAVVQVMSSLGLVNYLAPSVFHYLSTSLDTAPLSSDASAVSWTWPDPSTSAMSDVDFETFLDAEMLGTEWISTELQQHSSNDWITVDTTEDPGRVKEVDPLQTGLDAQSSEGIRQGLEGANTTSEICTEAEHVMMPNMTPVSQPRESTSGTEKTKDVANRSRTRKTNYVRMAFKSYVSLESRKFHDRPKLFQEHYGHMKAYEAALSSIRSNAPNVIATMALAIGDFSAISMLKQAIQSARSQFSGASFKVGRNMSRKERLDVIERLDVCMAHLRIVRWLHIHQLYHEAASEVGGRDTDNFINMTSADLCNDSSESRVASRHGNPRNLEQATITRCMIDHIDLDSEYKDRRQVQPSMTRLRRVGRKLQLMVKRWGVGIFSLLGSGFTDDTLKYVADSLFTQFLDVVDRFEGERIRAMSNAAESALQLFMDDCTLQPELRIEVTNSDVIERLPRLSQAMESLFAATMDI